MYRSVESIFIRLNINSTERYILAEIYSNALNMSLSSYKARVVTESESSRLKIIGNEYKKPAGRKRGVLYRNYLDSPEIKVLF